MKYFFQEPYDYLNKEEEQRAERLFAERCAAYDAEFANLIPMLPKRFVKEYQKYFFHDYDLEELTVKQKKGGLLLTLTLSDYEGDLLRIEYQDVRSLQMRVDNRRNTKVMAAELLPDEGNRISQEFSFWGDNTEDDLLFFSFSGLQFKKSSHSVQ